MWIKFPQNDECDCDKRCPKCGRRLPSAPAYSPIWRVPMPNDNTWIGDRPSDYSPPLTVTYS